MTFFFAYALCYSLIALALFGVALYLTAADNRRLRARLAEAGEAEVALRLREIEQCWN